MTLTLVISLFFGFVAAAAMVVNAAMIMRGFRAAQVIRAELASIDRATTVATTRVLRGRLAYA